MGVRNLTQESLQINSKNILGWLSLAIAIADIDDDTKNKIERYLKRTDKARRQREIDKIFGGDEW